MFRSNSNKAQTLMAPNMHTIAIDLDECIFPFVSNLDRYVNRVRGDVRPRSASREYLFGSRYGLTDAQCKYLVREFYHAKEYKTVLPIEGSVEALLRLRRKYRLICVTGRQHYARTPTYRFLDVHMPHVFDRVHFTNSFSLRGRERTKLSVCREEGAFALVDDNPKYIDECKSHMLTFAFTGTPTYPWAYDGTDAIKFAHWDACPLSYRSMVCEPEQSGGKK